MPYKSWSDLPWYERAILNAGSAIEGGFEKIGGMIGLEDYMPSQFSDVKSHIKTDIAQKGTSEGWDWESFGKGIPAYKIYDALVNEHDALDKYAGSSMQTGGGISGQGEQMKIHGGGVKGMGGSPLEGGESLGRRLAIQEEPALEEDNYNYNNFSF
jgi:hypothetical protein